MAVRTATPTRSQDISRSKDSGRIRLKVLVGDGTHDKDVLPHRVDQMTLNYLVHFSDV